MQSWNIQYDAQGRPFLDTPGGSGKIYISPAAMGDKNAPGGGGSPTPSGSFFTSRPEWNQYTGQYETHTNWGNVMALVVAGVITAGAATALMSGATVAEAGVAPEVAPDVTSAVAADTAAGAAPLSTDAATTLVSTATGPGFVAPVTATTATVPEAATVAAPTLASTAPDLSAAGGGAGPVGAAPSLTSTAPDLTPLASTPVTAAPSVLDTSGALPTEGGLAYGPDPALQSQLNAPSPTGPSTSSLLTNAGKIVSGIEQSRVNQANTQANQTNQANQVALNAAKLNLQAPAIDASNSVRGDILANAQPVRFDGPLTGTGGKMPVMSGGLTPSLFSANTRTLGANMSRDALLQQMKGPAFTPTPLPQPTALDTGLQVAGYVPLAAAALNLVNGS